MPVQSRLMARRKARRERQGRIKPDASTSKETQTEEAEASTEESPQSESPESTGDDV